jgi:hypothetical protein
MACPKAVEAEEELDFLAADDFANRFHGAFAAGAFERIAAPILRHLRRRGYGGQEGYGGQTMFAR